MKSKNVLSSLSIALVLHFGVLAGSAQTNMYLYSGSETNITLNPGTYIITAYGAPGGGNDSFPVDGGFGTEMSAEFSFSMSTTLTLLVGGCGDTYGDSASAGGGGGGGGFVVQGSTPLVIAGGGGGGPDAGAGNVSTNGGNGVSSPTHFNRGGGGGTGGGGGGGAPTVGGAEGRGGGGGGGGFLGNGGDGTNGDVFAEGGGGGSSFETGGGGGYAGNGFVPGSYGGYDGGGGGYGGGGGGGGTSGGGGGGGGYSGGGGGYGGGGGGGGGSIIDSSAIMNLTEVSGIRSPDDYNNGEIIIIAVTQPRIITTGATFGFTNGVFGFNVTGPSGSNVVIQASMDLQTWIPLQTNLLGSGVLYFSDPQSTANPRRFYRAELSP